MSRHPTRRKRSGWTFVELICVIAVLATIMGAVATFLGATHRFNAQTQSQLQFHTTVHRLATQFRRDIRDSVLVTVADQAITMDQMNAGSVVYQQTADGVLRIARDAQPAGARNGFWLPVDWQASWNHDERFVTLTLIPAPNTAASRIQIKAVLGGNALHAGK